MEEIPKLVPLRLSDPEYLRVEKIVYKQYPHSCIISIEKVAKIDDLFDNRLDSLGLDYEDSLTTEEIKEMFHGTKNSYVPSIVEKGFKSTFNRTSAYGKGTYFSPLIKVSLTGYTNVSKQGLSYVFLCDVIMEDTGGNKSDIYVCPRDDSFQIKYLIRFHKNAR